MSEESSEIGLIGLAVMGQNLALNIADHGFKISVYNRTASKMESFVAANPDTPGGLVGCATLSDFVASLKRPRKIIILVQAGQATDKVIDGLLPLLEAGDIIIDGGTPNGMIPFAVKKHSVNKVSALLAPASREEKKGSFRSISNAWRHPPRKRGNTSSQSGRRSRLKWTPTRVNHWKGRHLVSQSKVALVARPISGRMGLGITSKWCTTGLSMATCR